MKMISIAGPSGCGKTTLARELATRLDGTLLSMDRFYKPPESEDHDFDDPNSIDWNLLGKVLQEFYRKGESKVPIYSMTQQKTIGYEKLSVGRWLIFEGIWALRWDGNIRDYILDMIPNLSIWVDVGLDVAVMRRLQRDVNERGYDLKKGIDYYLRKVRPGYLRYVKGTREFAQLRIEDSRLEDLLRALDTPHLRNPIVRELCDYFTQDLERLHGGQDL